MRLHVSIGDEGSGDWRPVAAWEPDEKSAHGPETFSWKRQLLLPSGESLEIGAVYAPFNRGMSIGVTKGGAQLAFVGGFKLKPSTYDPTLILLSPGGTQVQVMLGV